MFLNYCQSGKISPNLVTLPSDSVVKESVLLNLPQKSGEVSDKFVKDTLAGTASDSGPSGDLQVGGI